MSRSEQQCREHGSLYNNRQSIEMLLVLLICSYHCQVSEGVKGSNNTSQGYDLYQLRSLAHYDAHPIPNSAQRSKLNLAPAASHERMADGSSRPKLKTTAQSIRSFNGQVNQSTNTPGPEHQNPRVNYPNISGNAWVIIIYVSGWCCWHIHVLDSWVAIIDIVELTGQSGDKAPRDRVPVRSPSILACTIWLESNAIAGAVRWRRNRPSRLGFTSPDPSEAVPTKFPGAFSATPVERALVLDNLKVYQQPR
ncbi:hypothetical protein I7I51_08548 [Histoplasma capsulatum]|uniref:Uncharacterized protein n=1 Tax=Ajellomyces capsulatus TaxID=5037 RepID=A0A8A1LY64_AJECA|nr:hypothetical protein I7I51_08548 [Histoplasma capsulatum]